MYDFLLIASTVLFLGMVLVFVRHPAASLAHPASLYLAFHGFIFVFRPIIARIYDFDFVYQLYEFEPSMANKITVILGANLAMLVFVVASLILASHPPETTPKVRFAETRARLALPIFVAAGLLTPVALAALFSNWSSRADYFENMMRDAATGNMVNIQGNGWFTDAALLMAPIAVMMVWLSRYRWWGWAYFAGFVFLQAGTGTRHAIIFAITAVAICWLLEQGRKWFDWRAVILALAAAVIFNQLVIDRGGAVRTLVSDDYGPGYVSDQDLDPLEHMDFANLEYFEYLVYAVPERTGTWDYFAHALQVFTEPVPRALWEDKPIGSPIQYFSLWDYGQPVGMTASMPGIGWMSLGYPGIIIQSLIFAALFGFAYRYLLLTRAGPVAQLAYALVIATALLGFRDGTLLTLLRTAPFYFGPLIFAYGLAHFAGRQTVRPVLAPEPQAVPAMTPAERRRAMAARAKEAKR